MGIPRIKRRFRYERGANLIEYVLLLIFAVIVVVLSVKLIGQKVSTQFSNVGGQV